MKILKTIKAIIPGALLTAVGLLMSFNSLSGPYPSPIPTSLYRIGDVGPGGGYIFFVDIDDHYPNFTYLEAAPIDVMEPTSTYAWCSNTTTDIGLSKWKYNAVGRGQANTEAMLAPSVDYSNPKLHGICTSGAAVAAYTYISPNGTHDWFLPSEMEMMLMCNNLHRVSVGGIAYHYYWTSTEITSTSALPQDCNDIYNTTYNKDNYFRVRPARAF